MADDTDKPADALLRHELRNSLNAISLSVAVLSRGGIGDVAEELEWVDAILSAADKAIDVLDRVRWD